MKFCLSLFALLLTFIASPLRAADPPPPSLSMAGFMRYEFNKWLFRPCLGAGDRSKLAAEGLPFIDATPDRALFTAIQERWKQSADPLRGVYLEFGGYAEGGRVSATDLHRVLGWVESCTARPVNVPKNALFWASGNEPFWSLVAEPAGAVFRTPEGETKLPAPKPQSADGVTAWDVVHEGKRLRIELAPGLCSDTMSEAAFGRKVVVAMAGRLYTGCGLVR